MKENINEGSLSFHWFLSVAITKLYSLRWKKIENLFIMHLSYLGEILKSRCLSHPFAYVIMFLKNSFQTQKWEKCKKKETKMMMFVFNYEYKCKVYWKGILLFPKQLSPTANVHWLNRQILWTGLRIHVRVCVSE